jgi:hypothetical protein
MAEVLVAVATAAYELTWQSPDLPAPTIDTRWPRGDHGPGWLLVEHIDDDQDGR